MRVRLTLKLAAAVLLLPFAAAAQTSGQAAAAHAAQVTPVAPADQATPAAPAPGTTVTTGALRGRAVDPTNAVIPGATITLTSADGKTYTTQSTGDGTYLIPNVAPGVYTVTTQINGFTPFTREGVKITAATATRVTLHLEPEVVTVVNVKSDNGNVLSVNPDSNASSLILTGKDLDALSDDPDELLDELNALAGPAAGPNGGQIYIDGFTGGQLPPKSSIREIRINQNPFSAQYDKIGYGRIEVFTKPGTDKLHGSFQLQGNDDVFNTAALVGSAPQPPYHTFFFQGNLSGPISKKASYNIGSNYRVIQDNNVVDTTIAPAPSYTPTSSNQPFIQSVFFPQTRIDLSPRLDLQVAPTNTLTARYQFDRNSQTNAGTGGNNLATTGYNSTDDNSEIQLSDSQTIGARVITETRFEYERDASSTTAQNPQLTTSVQGAFTDFGNGTGIQTDTSTHYELQSYTSVALKNNIIRFGGRLRINQDTNSNTSGFYGGFVYGANQVPVSANSTTYLMATGNTTDCPTNATSVTNPANPSGPPILVYFVSGICNYAVVHQQGAVNAYNAGFGATQFNANAGNPAVSASVADVGLYAEDEWKVRPNVTLTGGIRYETQNRIGDHHDFAPRLGVAWGIGSTKGGSPLFVVRGGFGIFYDRFGLSQVETLNRYNGSATGEQELTITNPNPATCDPTASTSPTASCITGAGGANASIPYSQAPNLRTPYIIQMGGSIEHQIIKPLTITLTYLNSRGNHQFFTQNTARNAGAAANAPNAYQYVSEGIFKQNQLIVQATYRGPGGTSLFGFYTYGHANGDTSGAGSFPSNSVVDPTTGTLLVPNNITADYGRTSQDIHQRLFFGGNIPLPYHIALSPFMIANSGAPFNVTLGSDLNKDNIFNDRPGFATPAACAAAAANPAANPATINSKYGCFNLNTQPTDPRIPINYAQGPAQVAFNLRVTKTFGFGAYLHGNPQQSGGRSDAVGGLAGPPGGGGGGGERRGGGAGFGGGGGTNTGRRYNLTIGAQALNLFNVVNYAPPIGVLSSPQFGQQTRLAGNIFSTNTAVRRITLQANFTF